MDYFFPPLIEALLLKCILRILLHLFQLIFVLLQYSQAPSVVDNNFNGLIYHTEGERDHIVFHLEFKKLYEHVTLQFHRSSFQCLV